MNRILFVILAALVIVGIFATGCAAGSSRFHWAPIEDVAISGIPLRHFPSSMYSLYVVSGESLGCDEFAYYVMRVEDTTILVEIFNAAYNWSCPDVNNYVEHTIPLGSGFVRGRTYTVKVNNVTETFRVPQVR